MTIEAMKQWRESLEELVPDPQCDFGPAYEGMKRRQKEALKSIDQAIAEAEKHEVSQEPVACKEDDVGNLEYRGNSVGYIFQKMTAYKKGIGDVWDALKSIGVHPDGKTSAPDAIRNLYTHPQPKREPLTDKQWQIMADTLHCAITRKQKDVIEAAIGITSDMKQEHVDEMAKQRHEWVGLTAEEIEQGCKESWVTLQAWQSAVWWAEAKLKEKNT